MSGREKFSKHKRIIHLCVWFFSHKTTKRKYKILDKYSKNNKIFSILVRYCIVKSLAKKCGDNVFIGKHVLLKNIEFMELGSNISINEFSYIDGGRGLTIGDNVSIAHGCSIIAANHSFNLNDIPFKYQPLTYKNINIGNNIWIGARAVLLAGVNIKDNVVIGASSVCTSKQEFNSNSLYAGNPALFKKEIL